MGTSDTMRFCGSTRFGRDVAHTPGNFCQNSGVYAEASRLARKHRARRLVPAGMLVGGILFAWLFLYAGGEAVVSLIGRMERMSWQQR